MCNLTDSPAFLTVDGRTSLRPGWGLAMAAGIAPHAWRAEAVRRVEVLDPWRHVRRPASRVVLACALIGGSLLMTSPARAEEVLFADGFESGHAKRWMATEPLSHPKIVCEDVDPGICEDPDCACGEWVWLDDCWWLPVACF